MAQKIKRNDMVKVIAGKDIDKEGKVLSVDAKNHKVVVEGINMATKHTKPSMQNQAALCRPARLPADFYCPWKCENIRLSGIAPESAAFDSADLYPAAFRFKSGIRRVRGRTANNLQTTNTVQT